MTDFNKNKNLDAIPIEMTVAIGQANLSIKEILSLQKGSVIHLNRRIDDSVEIYVSGKLIAEGLLEIQETTGEPILGVRIVEVVYHSNGSV
jgi:flagellar motor switch protein FliN/FliY